MSSSGLEACELAASVGLHLLPWQRDVLVHALGERADGRWAAREVAVIVPRQNGKGAIIEAMELFGLFLAGERLILHSAHEFKTAMEGFRRIVALIDGSDELRRLVKRVVNANGDEGIELRSGQRLRFVARSKGSGRGFSCDRLFLDEAYALESAQVAAMMPTMSAVPNPQIVYTSSPPLDGISGSQLFTVRSRGLSDSPGRLAYFDFGADAGVDLNDRDAWAAANPSLGSLISLEAVEAERAAMTDEDFGRERLGVWPADGQSAWAAIPEADWLATLDPASMPGDVVAFAADVTPDRSAAAIAVAGRRKDGLLHVEVVEHRPGTGWVADRLAALVERWKPCAVVVDAAGPAGSLIAPLEQRGIQAAKPSARDAAQACGQFYDAVLGEDVEDDNGATERVRQLRHIDQVELTTALAGAVRRPLGDAWAWNRRAPTVDISPLVAATLAAWGYETHAHLGGGSVAPWAVYA